MYLVDIVRRSLRSLWSAKTRTILTAFAIAVGTFALTLTLGASNGAQNYADNLISSNFDPAALIVSADGSVFSGSSDTSKPQEYSENLGTLSTVTGASAQVKLLTGQDIERLKQVPGVADAYPSITVSLQYITRDGQKKYAASLQPYKDYQNHVLLAGSVPANIPDNSVILPQGFVSALGFSSPQEAVGKTVRLAAKQQVDLSNVQSLLSQVQAGGVPSLPQASGQNANSEEQNFKVIAVYQPQTNVQPGTELYLLASRSDVTKLNDYINQDSSSYQRYLSAHVVVKDGTDVAKLTAAQDAIKKLGYSAQSVKDTEKTLTQIITVLQGIVTVFGLIAVVASVFGVVNTMYISVLQRTREIGLMKALGMHRKDITKLFRLEAALLGLLGGLIGSAIAVILGTLLNPVITKKLDLGNQHLLDFQWPQIVILIIVLMIVATIAGLLPARKASRLDPIEALRTE